MGDNEQVSKNSVEVSTAPYRTLADMRPLNSPAFDPVDDAPHHPGQPMPFWFVAEAMKMAEETSGKGSQDIIREVIGNLFRTAIAVNSSELANLFYFLILKLAPEFAGVETGVGHEVCVKSVAKASGKSVG